MEEEKERYQEGMKDFEYLNRKFLEEEMENEDSSIMLEKNRKKLVYPK
jgi:hypothetical protein